MEMKNRNFDKICKRVTAFVLAGVLATGFQPPVKVTAAQDTGTPVEAGVDAAYDVQMTDHAAYHWDGRLAASADKNTREAFYKSLKPGMAFVPTYEMMLSSAVVIPLTGKSKDAKTKRWSGYCFFPTYAKENDNPSLGSQTTTDAEIFEASIITESTPFTVTDNWGITFSGTVLKLSDIYGNRIGISDEPSNLGLGAATAFHSSEERESAFEFRKNVFADGSLANFGEGVTEDELYGNLDVFAGSMTRRICCSIGSTGQSVYQIGTDVAGAQLDFILCDDPSSDITGIHTTYKPTLWVGKVSRDAYEKVSAVDLKGYFTLYMDNFGQNAPLAGAFFDRDSYIVDYRSGGNITASDLEVLPIFEHKEPGADINGKINVWRQMRSVIFVADNVPSFKLWAKATKRDSNKNVTEIAIIRRDGPTGDFSKYCDTGTLAENFVYYTASQGRKIVTDVDGDDYVISQDMDITNVLVIDPGMTMHVKDNATLSISGTLVLRGKLIIDPGAAVVLYNGGGIQIANPYSTKSLGDELNTEAMSGTKNPKLAQILCYGSLTETEDSYIDLQNTMTKTWIDEQHTSFKDTRFSSFYAENANLMLAGDNSFAEDFQLINSQLTIPQSGCVIVGLYGKNNKAYKKADYDIFNRSYDSDDGESFFITQQYKIIYYYDHTYDGYDHTEEREAAYNAIYSFLGKGSTSERDREFNMCQTGKFSLKNSTIQSMGVFDFVRKPEVTTGNNAVWYKVYIFPYEEVWD